MSLACESRVTPFGREGDATATLYASSGANRAHGICGGFARARENFGGSPQAVNALGQCGHGGVVFDEVTRVGRCPLRASRAKIVQHPLYLTPGGVRRTDARRLEHIRCEPDGGERTQSVFVPEMLSIRVRVHSPAEQPELQLEGAEDTVFVGYLGQELCHAAIAPRQRLRGEVVCRVGFQRLLAQL